jgi:hypothetical protein
MPQSRPNVRLVTLTPPAFTYRPYPETVLHRRTATRRIFRARNHPIGERHLAINRLD